MGSLCLISETAGAFDDQAQDLPVLFAEHPAIAPADLESLRQSQTLPYPCGPPGVQAFCEWHVYGTQQGATTGRMPDTRVGSISAIWRQREAVLPGSGSVLGG